MVQYLAVIVLLGLLVLLVERLLLVRIRRSSRAPARVMDGCASTGTSTRSDGTAGGALPDRAAGRDPGGPTSGPSPSSLPGFPAGRTFVLLEWRNLQFWIDGSHILKGLNGSLRHGELTALMGESGSGKTSLLNTLSGRASYGVVSRHPLFNPAEPPRPNRSPTATPTLPHPTGPIRPDPSDPDADTDPERR